MIWLYITGQAQGAEFYQRCLYKFSKKFKFNLNQNQYSIIIKPDQWYIEFAKQHAIKLRTHDFYNPDLFLSDSTWVEITLSQNTAYQKIFRYGHQADKLLVLWLDEDVGYHKKICQNVRFPNAEINSIECYNTQLEKLSGGPDIIRRLKTLKKLKGIIH